MVTTIACLTVQPPKNRHMYDGGRVSSFDSHFANISDWHKNKYTYKYYVMRLFIGNINVG